MRTIETKVYKFKELSTVAQKDAVEHLYDLNTMHDWWDYHYEDAENAGIEITGFTLRGNTISGEVINGMEEVFENVLRDHGQDCKTVAIMIHFNAYKANFIDEAPKDENGDFEDEGALDEKIDELEKETLNDMLQEYLKMLQVEHDYRTSEEAIKESIEANDYEFYENGKLF